jgi:hypothetical protein
MDTYKYLNRLTGYWSNFTNRLVFPLQSRQHDTNLLLLMACSSGAWKHNTRMCYATLLRDQRLRPPSSARC